MFELLKIYRLWQKQNPEWELCCDVGNTEEFYIQWEELSKKERMFWVETYGGCGKEAFEEFAAKECKFEVAVLCPDLTIKDIIDWPHGFCMLIFKTNKRHVVSTL